MSARMTRRLAGGATVLVVVAVVASPLLAGASTGRSRAAAQAGPPPTWNTSLSECVAERSALQVLFLVDESKSLEDTDPFGLRVDALKASLLILAQVQSDVSSSDRDVDLRVGMAGFSVGVDRRVPFQPLSKESVGGLLTQAEQFRSRHVGLDTDYYAALQQSQAWLAEEASKATVGGGSPPCQLVVWFTDGQYDIEDRVAPATRKLPHRKDPDRSIDLAARGAGARLVQRGREVLCQPSGIVDQLRVSRIPLVAVGLNTAASPFDDSSLREMVSGATCGTDSPLGDLIATDDVDDLVFGLAGVAGGVTKGPALPHPDPNETVEVCTASADCPDTQSFRIEDSMSRFLVLGVPEQNGVAFELRGPDETEVVRLESNASGSTEYLGARLDTTWISPKLFLSTVTLPAAPALRGEWEATFIDPDGTRAGATARSRIQVFSDYDVDLKGPESLVRGHKAQFQIFVNSATADGVSPVDPEATEVSAILSVGADDANPVPLTVERGSAGWTGTVEVPENFAAAQAQVRVAAKPHADQVELPEAVRSFDFDVESPEGVPHVTTRRVAFGQISNKEPVTAKVVVRGDDDVDGCIRFGRPTVPRTVQDATAVRITVPKGCVAVPAGSKKSLTIRTVAGKGADVALIGTIPYQVQGGDERLDLRIEMSGQFVRRLTLVERAPRAVALLVAGIALPLLVMWLIGAWLARFRGQTGLFWAEYPVQIAEDAVRGTDGAPLAIELQAFHPIEGDDRARSFDLGATRFWARAPRSPFGAASGRASREGYLSAGAEGSAAGDAVVPLALRGSWVLHVDPSSAEVPDDDSGRFKLRGSLLLFVGTDAASSQDMVALVRRLGEEVLPGARALSQRIAAARDEDAPAAPDGAAPDVVGVFGSGDDSFTVPQPPVSSMFEDPTGAP
jgi:hypothetical protein